MEQEDNQHRTMTMGGWKSGPYGEGDDDTQGLGLLSIVDDMHLPLGTISLCLILVHSVSLVTLFARICGQGS
jgi:hypothetical protein